MPNMIDPVPIRSGFKGNFGEVRPDEIHPGVDIEAPSGTPVKSPMNGVVTVAEIDYNPKCGGTIDIDHKNGYITRFCHIKKINVSPGEQVSQGQVVGLSGGGLQDIGHGRTSGPHLHWSLRLNGKKVNPIEHRNLDVQMTDIDGSSEDPDEDVTSMVDKIFNNSMYDSDSSLLGSITKNMAKSVSGLSEEIKRFKSLIK